MSNGSLLRLIAMFANLAITVLQLPGVELYAGYGQCPVVREQLRSRLSRPRRIDRNRTGVGCVRLRHSELWAPPNDPRNSALSLVGPGACLEQRFPS